MRLTSTSVADETTPTSEEEANTVSYSGPHLAELMASGEMAALSAVTDVERTVVIPGGASHSSASYSSSSYSTPRAFEVTSASIAPVAYGMSRPYSGPVAVAPSRGTPPSRLGAGSVVAGVGLLLGLMVQMSLSPNAHAAEPAAAAAVTAKEAHEVASEKSALVGAIHAKATAPAKRHLRVSKGSSRAAGVAPAARADSAEAVSDAQLLRAAQLEQPL